MTNGSTCCPAVLYQGGRPAVYIVRARDCNTDSDAVFLVDWLTEVVLCLKVDRGDFINTKIQHIITLQKSNNNVKVEF